MTIEGDFEQGTAAVEGTPKPSGIGGRSETETLPVSDPRRLAGYMGLPIAEEQPPEEREEGQRAVLLATGVVGVWERHQVGGELVFSVPTEDDLEAARAARHAPVEFPQPQLQRIDWARTEAHRLGLPFTPDMTLGSVTEGARAVDGLGRVGVFREVGEHVEGEKRRVLFEPEDTVEQMRVTGERAIQGALDALTRGALLSAGGHNEQDAYDAIDKASDALRAKLCPSIPPKGAFGNDRDSPVYYYAPSTWPRNGREAGAWVAGMATRQRFCRVRMLTDHVDGAVTSLVAAGMLVGKHRGPDTYVAEPDDSEAHSYSVLDVECPGSLAWSF